MANAALLKGRLPYRGFHIGYPGSGKTGAIASLLNVGYKVRILDFEGNYGPLLAYADDRALANLDIVTLQDKIGGQGSNDEKYVPVSGIPQAFNTALKMLNHWKYKDDDGNEIDLGDPADWGPDTILVDDSLTSLALAVKRRAIKMSNASPLDMRSNVWGLGVEDLMAFIDKQKNDKRHYHLIINCHKQMLGPENFVNQDDKQMAKKGDSTMLDQKLEAIRDGFIPTRIYPASITKPNSQNIHGALPIMLEFDKIDGPRGTQRVIKTDSGPQIDVKIAGKGLKKAYAIETGLAEIFETLGYKAPGF